MKHPLILLLLAAFAIVVAACQTGPGAPPTATPGATKPNVVIVSPPSNFSAQTGDVVQVQSTSTDPGGVVLVELIVDGTTVQNSPTPNGQPQAQFSVIQSWTATTTGNHTITVRATNARLATGEASITINVGQKVAEVTPTLVVPPTQPIPTATGLPPATNVPATNTLVPQTCTLASTFVSDVTIPDNTTVAPGSTFVKSWAIQNSGTCTWGGGYGAVFVGGEAFGAGSPQPIPAANPGQTIVISIQMVAPTSPGQHSSVWQLRAPNGVVFGTKFDAVIVIPGAPTPKPPTPIPPTNVPPSGCQGTPIFSNFTANPQTVSPGQITTLSWGAVQNANAVYLTTPSGVQGVGTPGAVQVQPSQTTTYTLTAYCNTNAIQAQVTVNVQGGGGGCQGTPVFNGFYASPQTISAGQGSTLNWGLVQNANAVYLQLPNQTIGVSTPGSRNINPGSTTTYTLVAYCGNNQASIQTTVNVNGACSGNPNFNGFSANPSTIQKGQTSTLSWGIVTNATSVVLQTPDGNSGVATPGQLKVKPNVTTTYTLIAYCYNRSVQTSVTVTVQGPPKPTPTPTPLPGNNSVNSITVQQQGNKNWILKVQYYWNGIQPPGRLNAAGTNANNQQATNTGAADAVPGKTTTATIKVVNVGRGKPTQFWACLVGRDNVELACKTVPAP